MFRFLQNLFNYGPTPEESRIGFFPDMDAATEWARGVLAETGTDPEAEFCSRHERRARGEPAHRSGRGSTPGQATALESLFESHFFMSDTSV